MSTALAISAVSAVLQFYLANMFTGTSSMFGGTVSLTAQAPDLVQSSFGTGTSAENQINLFLHQVTYNAAWRNVGMPTLAADGVTRLSNPPLALDLHYLLTAYGSADWQAEGLLGYALMMFHENPVISRADVSYALNHLSTLNNLSTALKTSGLADQIEMIKITPATLGREEMAWLWTALKADYRPTFPFQVSVVLMQPVNNVSLAIPVLRRQVEAQAAAPSRMLAITPPNKQPAAAYSDEVSVSGVNLAAFNQVTLSNARLGLSFAVAAQHNAADGFTFVPNTQTQYPAGPPPAMYSVSAQVVDSAKNVLLSTGPLPLGLAEGLPSQTVASTTNGDGTRNVKITGLLLPVFQGQSVVLSLTDLSAPAPPAPLWSYATAAQPFSGDANTSLTFVFPRDLPLGVKLLANLIVDEVPGVISVDTTVNPPAYAGPWVTVS